MNQQKTEFAAEAEAPAKYDFRIRRYVLSGHSDICFLLPMSQKYVSSNMLRPFGSAEEAQLIAESTGYICDPDIEIYSLDDIDYVERTVL